MNFTLISYSVQGVKDEFPLDENTQCRAQQILMYMGEHCMALPDIERMALSRTYAVIPLMGIFPLQQLRDLDPKVNSREFAVDARELVLRTISEAAEDRYFVRDKLTELDKMVNPVHRIREEARYPGSRGGRGSRDRGRFEVDRPRRLDPDIVELAEASLALINAVGLILRTVSCPMPDGLDRNLEQCEKKLADMLVR